MIEPIADEETHHRALRRIEELWSAAPGSPEERELGALATLVDAYERKRFPIALAGAHEPASGEEATAQQARAVDLRRYTEGYAEAPETPEEIGAAEAAATQLLAEDPWE